MIATDSRSAEKFASSVITQKVSSPQGTIRLSRESGKALTITPGTSRAQCISRTSLTTLDMVQVQINTGLSNKKMQELAVTLNKTTKSKIVETKFRENFTMAGRKIEGLFKVSKISLTKPSTKTENLVDVVHCKSLGDFYNSILSVRAITSSPLIKLGIDGGGSFLKFSLSVISNVGCRNVTKTSASNDKSLLTVKHGKETSAKRQLLVAVAENVSETYENVKKILSLFGKIDAPFIISCNMKLANIICGIQSHSSKHPCCWCDVKSDDLKEQRTPRNFRSIKMQYKAFFDKGNGKMCAKDFHNVVHNPLFDQEDVKQVIEFIPPMELHLLLGIVNHLYKSMLKIWPEGKDWPLLLKLKLQPYHGGEFVGNDCHKLLKNIDVLQRIVESEKAEHMLGFVKTFQHFKSVVSSCFGRTLNTAYVQHIKDFKNSYLQLSVSVTPKAHAVFYHVPEFIALKGLALAIFSEQSTETLHSIFSAQWARYKRNPDHPSYGSQLRNCVIDYNSKHL